MALPVGKAGFNDPADIITYIVESMFFCECYRNFMNRRRTANLFSSLSKISRAVSSQIGSDRIVCVITKSINVNGGLAMPLYRFVCENCGREKNILLKLTQEAPLCPDCGGKLIKQISRVSSRCGNGGGCSSCGGGSCSSCGH